MKALGGVFEIIAAGVICWWLMAFVGMFVLTVCKYLVWFWLVIN
jgi:hypothetical protein|nr:MAG TPA: hypothetical protein [Caudoviricetes sp.]